MSIADRIRFIIHSHNLSNSTFADRLGIQRSNVSHVLSGRSKPGLDFLEKILKEFPRVDAHWLISGKTKQSSASILEDESFKVNDKSIQIENKAPASDNQSMKTEQAKTVFKIVHFYTDQTFDEFIPT